MKKTLLLGLLFIGIIQSNAQGQDLEQEPEQEQRQEQRPAQRKGQVRRKRKESLVQQYSGAGYGLAGCGLGSIVFGTQPGLVQVFASTTNNIYSNQSFGITSGTSNCDIPETGREAAMYLEINKEAVKKQTSRGHGESLRDLADIFSCHDQDKFNSMMQQNYLRIFPVSGDSYQSTREIMKLIDNNSDLKCQKS